MIPAIQTRLAFRRPKEPGRSCEDVVLGWPRHGRFAVSDGASISYDSRGWASTLCWHFMKDVNVGPEWLEVARTRFASRTPPPEDDWAAVNASERGSFATFLGFTITDTMLLAHGIGDTVLFVLTSDHGISLFPKLVLSDFAREPALLCSHPGRSAFPDTETSFSEGEFRLESPPHGWKGTYLIALTDALAEWVIGGDDDTARRFRLEQIAGHTRDSFNTWIAEAISDGRVRRDDCSALVIGL